MRRSARWPLENDLHQRGLDPACAQVSPHRGRGTTAAAADVGAGGPGRRGASRGRDSAEDCVEPSRGSAAVERADVAGRRPVSPIEPSHRLALRPHVRVRATSHTTTARVRRARTRPASPRHQGLRLRPDRRYGARRQRPLPRLLRSAALTPGRATARATRHARVPRRSQRVSGDGVKHGQREAAIFGLTADIRGEHSDGAVLGIGAHEAELATDDRDLR